MAEYEIKKIRDGDDAGKYTLYINGTPKKGAFTMEECMLQISEEEYPEPPENPAVNPCTKSCPARSSFCHAACPAHKLHVEWKRRKMDDMQRRSEAHRYTLDTTTKRMDNFRKKKLSTRKRRD